jgi:uroporphyrin-3 C-methyltransferase
MSESEQPSHENSESSPGEANPGKSAPDNKQPARHSGPSRKRGKAPEPPDDRPRERRRVSIIGVIALILALVALAGVGMLGWSWYQMRGQQTRVTTLSDRLAQLSGQTSTLEHTKADARQIDKLSEALHENKRDTQAKLKAIKTDLDKLSTRLAGTSTAYREDEAAALMRLAQSRANLAHDPAGAAKALKLAQKTLNDASDSALEPVQLALQREIAALKAVPKVNTDRLYIKLQAFGESVDNLPLAGRAVAKPSAPASASSGFSWNGLGAAFKRAFSPLIVVHHGQPARPLLPPDEAYFVRRNLQLTLSEAQLALLQHNAEAWQASLKEAQKWLGTWFLASDDSVKQARSSLAKLASTHIAPDIPTLGAALAKMSVLQRQRSSLMPASAPASTPAPGQASASGATHDQPL